MAYILSLETATKNCSVALSKDGELIQLIEFAEANFSHAEKLHVFIKDVLDQCGIGFDQLQAIAVSQGPGSYTGLRIGVSTAKGLCYALNLPLIAVNTLQALAKQLSITEGYVIPMIDARRMEVFASVYNAEGTCIEDISAKIIEGNSFDNLGDAPIHLLGDGAMKCQELLNAPNFVYYPELIYPSAREMVAIATAKFNAQDFADVAYFEPFYLKDFVMTTSSKKK